jgi:hypothetical protein
MARALGVFLLLCVTCAHAVDVLYTADLTYTVANGTTGVHRATFQGTQDDYQSTTDFPVYNPSTGALVTTVSIDSVECAFHYPVQLVGWIPAGQWVKKAVAQLYSNATDGDTATAANDGGLSGIPSYGIYSAGYDAAQTGESVSHLQVSRMGAHLRHLADRVHALRPHFVSRAPNPFAIARQSSGWSTALDVASLALGAFGAASGSYALYEIGQLRGDVTNLKSSVSELQLSTLDNTVGISYLNQYLNILFNSTGGVIDRQNQDAQFQRDINQNLTALAQTVFAVANMNAMLASNTSRWFTTLTDALANATAFESQQTYNTFKSLLQAETRQWTALDQYLLRDQTLEQIQNIQITNVATQRDARRMITRVITAQLANYTNPLPSTPFMRDRGVPNLSTNQLAAMRTVAQAQRVSTTSLRYTTFSAGVYTAREIIIRHLVDPIFFQNYTVPFPNFDTIFSYLGPGPTASTECYSLTNTSQTWACNSVLTIEKWSCVLTGSPIPMYPGNWSVGASLADSPEVGTKCAGSPGTATPTFVDPTVTTDTLRSIFTLPQSFVTWWGAQCPIWAAAALWNSQASTAASNVSHIRVYSQDIGAFQDILLNVTDPAACDANWVTASNRLNAQYYVAYNLYVYAVQAYSSKRRAVYTALETLIYGIPPTDTEENRFLFSRIPFVANVYETFELYWQSIATTKIPVYTSHPIDEQQCLVRFRIGDGTQQLAYGQWTSQITGGNFSIVTPLSYTIPSGSLRPSGPFSFVGEFRNPLKPDPDVIYDAPFRSMDTLGPRCDTLLYYMQSSALYASTDPINATQFINDNAISPRPLSCGSRSASYYKRQLIDNGFGVTTCGPYLPENGDRLGATTVGVYQQGDADWCTYMKAHEITSNVSASGDLVALTWRPRIYSVQFTIEVPVGTITQNLRTACPSRYTVQPRVGLSLLALETDATAPQQIVVKIVGSQGSCGQPGVQTHTYSATNPLALSLQDCARNYVQVYTVASDIPCYPDPGIPINITQIGQAAIGVTPAIQTLVSVSQSALTSDIAFIARQYATGIAQMTAVQTMAQLSADQQAATILALGKAYATSILDYVPQIESSFEGLRQTAAALALRAEAIANASAARQAGIDANADASALAAAVFANQSIGWKAAFNYINNLTQDALLHINRSEANLAKVGDWAPFSLAGAFDNFGGGIKSWADSIGNIFTGGGIGNFAMAVMGAILPCCILLVVIGGLLFCCFSCGPSCCKSCAGAMKKSIDRRREEGQVQRTIRRDPSVSRSEKRGLLSTRAQVTPSTVAMARSAPVASVSHGDLV